MPPAKLLHQLTIVVLILAFSAWGHSLWQRHTLKLKAQAIQANLEDYHSTGKPYPSSLSDAMIEANPEGPIQYQLEPDGSYLLWYGTTLGESVTYSSRDGDWSAW